LTAAPTTVPLPYKYEQQDEPAGLAALNAKKQPRWVYLEVENEQDRPNGLAANIEILTSMRYSRPNSAPLNVLRRSNLAVLGAGKRAAMPLFNIEGVPVESVKVLKLNYGDIRGKRLQAGYGTGELIFKGGTIEETEAVFEKGRREWR